MGDVPVVRVYKVCVLPDSCFLQVLPKPGTLRMNVVVYRGTLFSVRMQMEKDSLGSGVKKSDVMALQTHCCLRLAKEACFCTSPKTLLVGGVVFQLHLRYVYLQGSLVMLQASVLLGLV